jgi:hypothetical protein
MTHKTLAELAPNPKNPRRVTDAKLAMLKASMERFGDLGGIVFNRRSSHLVGGHQRLAAYRASALQDVVITTEHDAPTAAGTLREGYIVAKNGERFSYREVDWDEPTEMAANLAANKGAGEFELPSVAEFMSHLEAVEFDLDLTGFDEQEREMLRYELPTAGTQTQTLGAGPAYETPSEMGKAQGQDHDTEIDSQRFEGMGAECPRCGFHFTPKPT